MGEERFATNGLSPPHPVKHFRNKFSVSVALLDRNCRYDGGYTGCTNNLDKIARSRKQDHMCSDSEQHFPSDYISEPIDYEIDTYHIHMYADLQASLLFH
jgi:hypothetical protein